MPDTFRVLLFWLAVAFSLLLLHTSSVSLAYLEYNRSLIMNHGQWWRIWTCNWVHLSNAHVLMDVGFMLLVVLLLIDKTTIWEGLVILSVIPLGVGLGLLFFVPSIVQYAGFSGVDQGLLSYAIIRSWSSDRALFSLFLIAQFLRLCWEHSSFYNPYYMYHVLHAAVAYQAHTYGAITGLFCALSRRALYEIKSSADSVA